VSKEFTRDQRCPNPARFPDPRLYRQRGGPKRRSGATAARLQRLAKAQGVRLARAESLVICS